MSILALNLSRYEQDIINSVDSSLSRDIVPARLLGCIASYMQMNGDSCGDGNWARVKEAISLLETSSSYYGNLLEALAGMLACVKKDTSSPYAELAFLFALGGYYADKLDQHHDLSEDGRDLLLDFWDCHERWVENKDPFAAATEETADWDIPSLMEIWSCLHYYPARWAINDYLGSLRPSLASLLDVNGAISTFSAKEVVVKEDINKLRDEIDLALQSHLPSCFHEVKDRLLFSFTSPFIHELYTRLYLLATMQSSAMEEDLVLCRRYLSRLSINNIELFEERLWKGLLRQECLSASDILHAFTPPLQSFLLENRMAGSYATSDDDLLLIKALRGALWLQNKAWQEEIISVLPPSLYQLVEDSSAAMVQNPDETIDSLTVDDFFAMDTTAQSVEKVFTRCFPSASLQPACFFYHKSEEPALSHALSMQDERYIITGSGRKIGSLEFCSSPYFQKLKDKDKIFSSLATLARAGDYNTCFFQFINALEQSSWYECCAEDPIKKAHFATMAFLSGEISEEAFFVIHRVCEAYQDSSVSPYFTVLDRSNIEAFLEQRNYPPYAYQKSLARQKDFQHFLSSLDTRSIVERTCIEYRLEHYSPKNIERFVSEKAEYKEGCRFAQQDGDLSVFYTLLPPFLNIELYNSLVSDDKKRSPDDYVWGFGYSVDHAPFFQAKRPISIASVYHSLEDLSNFTIHGFSQPDAKSLGLDFHDCAYHIPIEMNLTKDEVAFLGFAAESMYHFSQKLFEVCADPIQKKRYQDMFSLYLDAMIDREIFVASGGGRLLSKRVDVRKISTKIHRHPLIAHLKNRLPQFDRLSVDIASIPRRLYTDTSRYLARCEEDLSEDRPPVITLSFGLKASK